jgi:hypothetical protein
VTQNVMPLWSAVGWMAGGAFILLLFALFLALPHRPRILPGSSGHRNKDDETVHETIRPDGYIDSFSREIEEAGGSLPPVVRIALPGILLWWLVYLILFWTERS